MSDQPRRPVFFWLVLLACLVYAGSGVTESLTKEGAVMGTFGYMAPEVFTGGAVDERADIFAIGVMTVETLVGERPFGGQTTHEVLTALLNSEYHLPGESIEIRALDAVVQRCLARILEIAMARRPNSRRNWSLRSRDAQALKHATS